MERFPVAGRLMLEAIQVVSLGKPSAPQAGRHTGRTLSKDSASGSCLIVKRVLPSAARVFTSSSWSFSRPCRLHGGTQFAARLCRGTAQCAL